jgi:hypothetical protein
MTVPGHLYLPLGGERQTDTSGIYTTTRQLGGSLGTAIIGIVLAIGFNLGLISGIYGTPPRIPLDKAQWVPGTADAAISQGMEWAFSAMLIMVIGMFYCRPVHPEDWEDNVRQ